MDTFINIPGDGVTSINGLIGAVSLIAGSGITITPSGNSLIIASTGGGGSGTVTSVSVVSANGFTGTVATPTTTPAITLGTSVTGILYGNGTSIAAAIPSNFPTLNQNTTGTSSNITATSNSTLTTLSSLSLPYSQLTGVPPISGFTQGSVLFANSSGQISQDNANFYWNDSTLNLGLGTVPATNVAVDIVNTTDSSKAIQTTSYGAGSSIPFRGRFARGTLLSPAAAQSGDNLSVLSGRGYGTSQFATASTGAINIVAGGTFTNTSNPTFLQFEVTPVGSVTLAEAMRIAPTGNVLIDTTTDNGLDSLQIGSGISANYVKFAGSTSGYVQVTVPATVTTYPVSLPTSQGAASSYLVNDGSGNLTWTTGTPPVVTNNIDGGSSATLYTSPQIISGGSP